MKKFLPIFVLAFLAIVVIAVGSLFLILRNQQTQVQESNPTSQNPTTQQAPKDDISTETDQIDQQLKGIDSNDFSTFTYDDINK